MAFGLIDTIDPEYIQELEDHLAKVSHRKMLEDNDRKVKERNRLLSEMKKFSPSHRTNNPVGKRGTR